MPRKGEGLTKTERVFVLKARVLMIKLLELEKQVCQKDKEKVRSAYTSAFLGSIAFGPDNIDEQERTIREEYPEYFKSEFVKP